MTSLKSKRLEAGLSQFDLYKKTDIGPWRISQFERGLVPRKEEAKKIAEALGINVNELFPEMQGKEAVA